MKVAVLEQHVTKLWTERNSVLVVAVIMAFTNLILVGGYMFKGERTILVPPEITKPFWVGGGKVSREYLEEMALFFSMFLLDMSPETAEYKHKVLLKYVAPENYGSLKKKFLKDQEAYKTLQLATTFKPRQVKVYPDKLEAEVKGSLSSFVASDKVRTEEHTLHLKFALRGAGLLLDEVKGGISDDR